MTPDSYLIRKTSTLDNQLFNILESIARWSGLMIRLGKTSLDASFTCFDADPGARILRWIRCLVDGITNSRGGVDSIPVVFIISTLILIMRLFQTEVIIALWTLSQPLRTNSIAFVLRSYHRPYTLIVKFLSSYAVLVKKTVRTSSRWHVLNSDSQFRFLLNRLWLESY